MREIDIQLGIDAELSSSINDSPGGANVVIVHNVKTHAGMRVTRALPATTNCSCAASSYL